MSDAEPTPLEVLHPVSGSRLPFLGASVSFESIQHMQAFLEKVLDFVVDC